jgi:hypothetical protein
VSISDVIPADHVCLGHGWRDDFVGHGVVERRHGLRRARRAACGSIAGGESLHRVESVDQHRTIASSSTSSSSDSYKLLITPDGAGLQHYFRNRKRRTSAPTHQADHVHTTAVTAGDTSTASATSTTAATRSRASASIRIRRR